MSQILKRVSQCFVEILMILFYFPSGLLNYFFLQPHDYKGTRDKGTIVLVERWVHSNILHNKWVRYLEEQGFRVYMINFPIHKVTFEQSARQLVQFFDDKKISDATLVGISNGGISAYLFLQKFDGWKRVKQFISVGTPFGGTYIALPLSFIKGFGELLPSSSFIRSLQTETVKNKDRITCLSAKLDGFVPANHCSLPGVDRTMINIYGHNNLHLRCKKTYDIVLEKAKSI